MFYFKDFVQQHRSRFVVSCDQYDPEEDFLGQLTFQFFHNLWLYFGIVRVRFDNFENREETTARLQEASLWDSFIDLWPKVQDIFHVAHSLEQDDFKEETRPLHLFPELSGEVSSKTAPPSQPAPRFTITPEQSWTLRSIDPLEAAKEELALVQAAMILSPSTQKESAGEASGDDGHSEGSQDDLAAAQAMGNLSIAGMDMDVDTRRASLKRKRAVHHHHTHKRMRRA